MKWFPKEKKGTARTIFAAGNVGAAVVKLAVPAIMIASGRGTVALVWAIAITAVIFFLFINDDPDLARRHAAGQAPKANQQISAR